MHLGNHDCYLTHTGSLAQTGIYPTYLEQRNLFIGIRDIDVDRPKYERVIQLEKSSKTKNQKFRNVRRRWHSWRHIETVPSLVS